MSKSIQVKNIRVSFPNIIEATRSQMFPDADKRFRCDLIFDKTDPQFPAVMALIGEAAAEKWQSHAPTVLQNMDVKNRCWGRGEEKVKAKTFEVYDGYTNGMFIKTSNYEDNPPVIFNADAMPVENGTPMRQMEARKIYGGCYANAVLSFKAWDNNGSRGVRCTLVAIQFAKDGAPFGEAPPDLTGMFAPVQGATPPVPAAGGTPPWM
jgi:hypothetical protein